MPFAPTHRYAQQATKLTNALFAATSVLTVIFLALVIWQSWGWLLGIIGVMLGWALYSAFMPTVPVRDLTTGTTHTVNTADWRAFKRQYPKQVAKPGTKA